MSKRLRVVYLHCAYKNSLGGEDVSAQTEAELLRDGGHTVFLKKFYNADIGPAESFYRQVHSSKSVFDEVSDLIRDLKPDVVHVGNIVWRLGPAAIAAAHAQGKPVVVSVRNERFLYDWKDVAKRTYNKSLIQTLALVLCNKLHGNIFNDCVDVYVPVSNYIKRRMDEAGFALNVKRIVKHNTLSYTPGLHLYPDQNTALFASRSVPEKGIEVLAKAWIMLIKQFTRDGLPLPTLKLTGKYDELSYTCANTIKYLGQLEHVDLIEEMGKTGVVVVPSIWHEPFGRVAVEALSKGTPVIASDIGGLPETRPTHLVPPGYVFDLYRTLKSLFTLDQETYQACRKMARSRFEDYFSPARNRRELENIYTEAIHQHSLKGHHSWGDLRDPATDQHLEMLDNA